MNKQASWYKRILEAVIKNPATVVIKGTIYKMDSYPERTGYRRFFMIQWTETFDKDIQHHELPVNAWNTVARQVRGDSYDDGDVVEVIGKLKTHKGEIYVELLDIRRSDG